MNYNFVFRLIIVFHLFYGLLFLGFTYTSFLSFQEMLIESDLIGNDSPFWTILNFVKNDIILGLVCIISSFVFLNRNNLAWSFFTASVIVHLLNILIVLKGASFEFFLSNYFWIYIVLIVFAIVLRFKCVVFVCKKGKKRFV